MIFEIDEKNFDRRAWEHEWRRLEVWKGGLDEPMMYQIDKKEGKIVLTAFFGPLMADVFDETVIEKMGGVKVYRETCLKFVVPRPERKNFFAGEGGLFSDLGLILPAFCHFKYEIETMVSGEIEVCITFQDFSNDSGRHYIKKRMNRFKASMV